MHQAVGAYQSSLNDLRRASRELAAHLDSTRDEELVTSTMFTELWADYKRALEHCKQIYLQVPPKDRDHLPRVPDR
jgi:hypothetical protein